ncbi:SdpA family antimicrobial peptide system protein [Mycobacterium yunnanensis]|uniref:SdpA family antimicrobial peptide system protein n=2 Tax=Mycobacterium yunnanensis TaxID=368477 RepID=A0A9X2Z9E3_9MYCO|nr:SdpA family antimicrobial peptide system protein [Mycobacterium yunnanensis]
MTGDAPEIDSQKTTVRLGRVELVTVTVRVPRAMLVLLGIGVSILILATAAPQLPANILHVPRDTPMSRVLTAAFPQGWAFFTRSPNADQYRVYRVSPGRPPRSLDLTPYSEPANAFGLDRTPRQQGAELQYLSTQMHDADWRPCRSDDECLRLPTKPVPVVNASRRQTYCGPVTVIAYNVTPWSDRHLGSSPWIDKRAVHLDIRCATS